MASMFDTIVPLGTSQPAAQQGGSMFDSIVPLNTGTTPASGGTMFDRIAPISPFGASMSATTQQASTGAPSLNAFVQGAVQALPRDAATIGVSTGQAGANIYSAIAKELNLPGQGLGEKSVGVNIPTGNLSWLLGDQPIQGLADQTSQALDWIQNSSFMQKHGLTNPAIAYPLAIASAIVPPSLDFVGMGGEESAIKALSKASTEGEVVLIGQRIGVAPDLLEQFSKAVAPETDPAKIKDIVNSFSHIQAVTKFQDTLSSGAHVQALQDRAAATEPLSVSPELAPKDAPTNQLEHETPQPSTVSGPVNPKHVDEYLSKFGNELNTDNARELFAHYTEDRSRSADVHEPASDIVKAAYKRMLDEKKGTGNNTVLFTAGGTGAGKSSSLRLNGIDTSKYPIVYDTNMNTEGGAVKKIQQALDSGYQVEVSYTHNDPHTALDNAMGRSERMAQEKGSGRTVPLKNHAETHLGAQETLPKLYERFKDNPNVNIVLHDNRGNAHGGVFTGPEMVDHLEKTRYSGTNEDLISQLKQKVEDAHSSGKISEQTKNGFLQGTIEKTTPADRPGLRGSTENGQLAVRKLAESGISPEVDPKSPSTIQKKVVAQTFREDKLNLNPDELLGVTQRMKALGLDTRDVRTFGDMQDAAQALGIDVKTLLTEVRQNRITDTEVVGLRNLINHNAQLQVDLEKQLLDKPGDFEITRKLRIASVLTDEALKKLVRGGTAAGRAVAAFRLIAARSMDPALWMAKAQKVLKDAPLTNEHKAAILDLIHKRDRQGLAEYVAMLRSPSFAEKAITLWKAGLLTSFTTHLANIGGNITMGLLSAATDVTATTLDTMAYMVTGERTTTASLATIAARARGAVSGVKDAAHFMKTGMYTEDLLNKYDLPPVQVFKNKILKGYTDAVFRSLGAEDIIFRQSALSASMERQAEVIAKNEGLSGDAARVRIGALLKDPTNEMTMKAIDASEYETFNNKNVLSDFITRGKAGVRDQGMGGKALYAVVEVVAPFVRTPTNVAARIADYSPAGFIKAMVRFANPTTRSQEHLVQDLSRSLTGSGVMMFGAYLYQKGLMTGNAPTNPGELAAFQASGKQANSIYLGGRWWNMNRLSPFGNLLGLGAEFETLAQDQSGLPLAFSTSIAGIQQLTQQTFLQGVSGALSAINDPARSAQTYFNSTASSVVPSIVGRVAQTIDPTKRVPDGVLQAIEAKLPFLSESLPAKRDVFGNVTQVTGGRWNLVDPFGSTASNNDPLLSEASRLGYNITQPSKTVANGSYTNQEYSVVQLVRGQVLHSALSTLVASPEYQQESTAQQAKVFKKTVEEVNQEVDDQVYPALMIKRYGLPADTDTDVLKSLMTTLNKEPMFKQGTTEWQGRVIAKILDAAASANTGDVLPDATQ